MFNYKPIEHFKTITEHRNTVMKECFKVGLYKQGLLHDLSKYLPGEFWVGAKYYQGYRSPNNAEREDKGYSSAWLLHKGRNKHHYEYWIDYSATEGVGTTPVQMPDNYFVEMVMDRIAASKIYNKGNYTDDMPLQYYLKGKAHLVIHEQTARSLEFILTMLAKEGEDATFSYIRKNILHNDKKCEFVRKFFSNELFK